MSRDTHWNAAMQNAFNLLPSGIVLTDSRGTIQMVNPWVESFLGYPEIELVGKKLSSLLVESEEDLDKRLAQEMKGSSFFFKKKAGDEARVLVSATKLRVLGEQKDKVIFSIEDASAFSDIVRERLESAMPILQKVALGDLSSDIPTLERADPFTEHFFALNLMIGDFRNLMEENLRQAKILEEEKNRLAEAKAKDEAILESIGDGVVAVDEKGKIMLVNRVAEEALGAMLEVLQGKFIWNTFDIKDRTGLPLPMDMRPVSVALSTGKKVIFSSNQGFTFETPHKTFPIAITVSPILLEGKIIGAVQVFRDVTEERQVDKAKSEFVSLASHQLRTPLTAINWYTEMLMNGDAGVMTDEQKDYAHEVHVSSKRMVDLVNSLLNVSRIELGTLSVDPEALHFEEIADSVLSELRPQIETKKLEIKKIYAPSLPVVQADPKLVGIIFQNILSNAVKYTPPQGVISLTIECDQRDMVLTFSDTGYGIPKAQQSKIFSKLFRADNVLAKDTEGTGLGLYLVKSIVDQNDGQISFESEENKGTTFHVRLPLTGMKKKAGAKTLIPSS